MTIYILPGAPTPTSGALVVCAGTVTCHNVNQMGAGFNFFKNLFADGLHVQDTSQKWVDVYNDMLAKFHKETHYQLPVYQRMACKQSYVGGIATVANYTSGANPEKLLTRSDNQYKRAVLAAIHDAISLQKPLYIQPLGIGVYGWSPQTAAKIFARAIAEIDSKKLPDIYIPIYQSVNKTSNDCQFATHLLDELKRLNIQVNNGLEAKKNNAETSSSHATQSVTPRHALRPSSHFFLKCLAYFCLASSAALLITAALVASSLLNTTICTGLTLSMVGVACGVGGYFLFRKLRAQENEGLSNQHTPPVR